MVKKGKKEDKLLAEDVFDPILIESRQAGTAVLMLASSEADVQAHACEAIYKFVVKNDENKKTLLDLNACEPLLELMKNEDRIVHRNALAALATMCAHPDVRKVLRKRKDCVPTFISLLQSEEETVVLEFASLGLNYLSTEYVSKVEILNSQAFEPLIHCLSHHDPDVQKNSIEAISQLVLNYQCQRVMKDLNGFPPVLELLKSEYAIIQRLALLVLERCSHDVENRVILRELDIVNKMIYLIGHPDWLDLHIMAVMVLSNMMEDIETVETFKEGLGLRKLIALITDQTPPEEEVQPKKGEKKSSKSGKKGKEVKSVKEEEVTSPAVDTVFPLLPDVKCAATKAIGRAARNAESRRILHELEVEKMLITLLSHENSSIQAAAANTLAVMCENLTCRQAVLDGEGFLPLIRLLRSDNSETLQAVTLVLRYLTTANLSSCLEVSKSHGIGPLIHLLEDSSENAVSNAAAVLTNLALHESLRQDVKQKGVVSALVKALKFVNNKSTQSQVLLALANYASSPLSRDELRYANGIEPVVKLLKSEDKDVVKNAAWAIYVSAADEATAHEICICGGLNTLQEINLNPTRRNQFTAIALERLFDNNLSAKFSFCGYLAPTNIITDGFFYAGRLKLDAEFKSLEELSTQKMKDRKSIIVINAKFEAPAKDDEKQEDLNSRVLFKFKRDGRSRNPKERIEKGKEEEEFTSTTGEDKPTVTVIECEEKNFVLPEDPELGGYVDEITKELTNMNNFLEQIITLAKFVSNKMGGAVSREEYGNFSWELPLSQIQHERASNIVSIGSIKYGNQFHRALLFKVLADRVIIRCSLVHGDFFKAWNIVLLGNEDSETVGQKDDVNSPLKAYIVDVIHEPGRLILVDTPEAIRYCTM
ncbi:armadillo repeat-containing protein 3 [Octopus bimaculoides]|uniref:EDR1/CTR1/ARMC3-like peptidase-like domain-containing protein n=1 Tax=Octopus bimaculoides TaxID=37653 RepID=A0A0L8H5E3_OCTBM|nr:armadillo repeat-containing protein 3 [Octopus bimaculoides]XP_014775217.1 armadillo repeat-containing protein 3 [Octopus bimaculoides]|eukprot:XP_014775215.1 PREDICTED: armadillo repeat-containing protein 3-like [Octopus bimaculoides]